MNKSQFLSALKSVLSFFNQDRGATWFKFSYTWLDGTSVMGVVRGNLQADQNTVLNLSSVLAFVKNPDGVFISEFLDILILGTDNHLTLDGSSLEFGFTSSTGDLVKFLGSTSDLLFTSSVVIDDVRVISFEQINPANWNMAQCFLNKSQSYLIDEVRRQKNSVNYQLKSRE